MRTLAYLDGTSAGMIGGAIAAGFAGVVVFVKMQFARIRGSVGGKQGAATEPEAAEPAASADEA